MLQHLHAVSKDLSKIETLFHVSDNPLSEERLDDVGSGVYSVNRPGRFQLASTGTIFCWGTRLF